MTNGPPKIPPARRPPLQRLIFRRQFLLQLPRIVASRVCARGGGRRVFVSLMGGVGDLVNFFPTVERLAARGVVDMGTDGGSYHAMVADNPFVAHVFAPFVYKPARPAHRRLIERVLAPFYDHVFLADCDDPDWWRRGEHLSARTARTCGCAPPTRSAIYLTDAQRAAASRHLERFGIDEFVFVAQVVRRRRAFRSWPLPHTHALLAALRKRTRATLIVDTSGSDERTVPDFCFALPEIDIMTTAAIIKRARLFIGADGGLTHVAAALGVPTLAIHLGFPPESSRALGDNVVLVAQREPFDDPAATTPDMVLAALDALSIAA